MYLLVVGLFPVVYAVAAMATYRLLWWKAPETSVPVRLFLSAAWFLTIMFVVDLAVQVPSDSENLTRAHVAEKKLDRVRHILKGEITE